jgi:hypothetical protein
MTDLTIEGFTDREFSVEELSEAINIIPNRYGLITALGIFAAPTALSTTYVALERQNWTLNLLPATERGGPGTKGTVGKRDRKLFEIPQITHEDDVKVADVQNLRAFGSKAGKMLEELINEKLITMANKHYVTHEWYRVNALQGKILDSDGSVMLNLFTEFNITQPVAAFGAVGATVPVLLRTIKRQIERSLKGEVMSGIGAIASPEFMEMLFADTEIKAAYNASLTAWEVAVRLNPTLADRRFSFTVQEITFMEYPATFNAPNADGTFTVRRAIPSGDCIFFPLGTQQTARQYVAPGDFEEAINMPGQLLYAKEKRDPWGRGRELLTQSNLLPMWNQPELLVRGTTGASGGNVTDMPS